MINKKIEKILNEQVALEAASSLQYLAMASWLENNGFYGTAGFIYEQVEEEHMHMIKVFRYINEAGGVAKAPSIAEVQLEFKGYSELFNKILDNERKVSSAIHDIVDACLKEKDYTTFNFMQWYVSEQLEEENLFSELVDKIKMVGASKDALYLLDRDLGSLRPAAASANPGKKM